MYKKILFFSLGTLWVNALFAQDIQQETQNNTTIATDTATVVETKEVSEIPVISYSLNNDKKYTIADITVSGISGYDDFVLIGISGLSIGDKVGVPGEEITSAIKLFWKHGLFSDVKILATKLTKDSVWLNIALKPNPIISFINITGVKKGEREDLEKKIGMTKGSQLTPNLINRARKRVKDYFDEKGFSNANVRVLQRDDLSSEGHVILDITVDKQEKTKIREIFITGNENLSDYTLKVAMKKTNEGFSLKKRFKLSFRKMFSTKKFVKEEYENDLNNILLKYSEKGYRDARIFSDSVEYVDEKHVNIHIKIEEGNQYFIRNIKWVGNTIYPSEFLENILNMQSGDIYNQKKLTERLSSDEDAVSNIYYNSGYIFSRMDPVETYIQNDSVDIEVRIFEGIQATINRVIINGNDRLYEDIIRRELMTKPGQLFSREVLMRSVREIAQMGHFDPESMDIQPIPDAESGTVDIQYNLTSKANDQVELSAGWGQTGLIGRLSFKFTNFSFNNLIRPNTYKGIIPQGEGQTLTVGGQTNGRYYQAYNISFTDPWFGGKRPNTFSLGAYYMIQTGMDDRYYSNYYNMSNYYYSGDYGYNSYVAYDENQSLKLFGASATYGKRLKWPDDYFSFMTELSFQKYWLHNWNYFIIQNGNCNNVSLGLTLARNSIDNPLYTREGSQFSASLNFTPPYSLWDKVDYANLSGIEYDYSRPSEERNRATAEKNKWIEYHKWKFKGKVFIPLANKERVKRTPVLMSRIEYGFLGSYNSNKRTPFETFYMGGDGMNSYSTMYATETVGLRGYENGALTPYGREGYAYSRLSLELRYPFMLEQSATIYGLTFIEAGNAWTNIASFNPFDLKRSAGAGIRIFLPMIGLMGLDWAYGFDKATTSSSKISGSQIHFILGQEF
ncbi:MAG: outer membrane protein assembly factor BamA [Dysgonamonadaceae bacterium]|jgi:outer membrane protein insertion porin family|nr:outer membrane protein assembly factor BamA [Dysgonamonadaceae bacterium]